MNIEAALKALGTIAASGVVVEYLLGRKKRLRQEIAENLALLSQLKEYEVLNDREGLTTALYQRVAFDILKVSGIKGRMKKPIPWLSVFFSIVLSAGLGLWSYLLSQPSFNWWSVATGIGAVLFALSAYGSIVDRDLLDDEQGIPAGATAIRTSTTEEQIASEVAMVVHEMDGAFLQSQQVKVARAFVELMRKGMYDEGIRLADENWLRCRIQAWLWNNLDHEDVDWDRRDEVVNELLQSEPDNPLWNSFRASESSQFAREWADLSSENLGTASRRRIIGPGLDLVIMVELRHGVGYYVTSATALPNSMQFLMRREGEGWRVANHIGIAPPFSTWPPIWWSTVDDAMISAVLADESPAVDLEVATDSE